MKMSRMGKEQTVFEKLTLSDFKMCSPTTLKTDDSDNMRYHECGAVVFVTNF